MNTLRTILVSGLAVLSSFTPFSHAWADKPAAAPEPEASAPQADAPAASKAQKLQKPFLWKVETDPPSYLFGTVHLPDPRVTALPDSVTGALEASDHFVSELPLDAGTQVKMAQAMSLPGDDTLKTLLPAPLYAEVELFLGKRGLPLVALNKLKIWALTQMVGLIDYVPTMAMNPALDVVLYRTAKSGEKAVSALETLDEQLAVFDSLSTEEQITMLGEALAEIKRQAAQGTSPTEGVVQAYLTGELDELQKTIDAQPEARSELSQKFMKELLEKRNLRMAERVAKMLKENPGTSYFIAVGAAHYLGETGLIEQLGKKGFKIERVTGASAVAAAPAAAGD